MKKRHDILVSPTKNGEFEPVIASKHSRKVSPSINRNDIIFSILLKLL